jgi:hypothetical protein
MGLTVREDEATGGGLGAAASSLAFHGAALSAVCHWQDLPIAIAWIGLGFGGFAVGLAMVRFAIGQVRDFGDLLSALGATLLGGAAIAGVMVPALPSIIMAVWLALTVLGILFVDS